jgi:hypothetical protein
MLQQQAIDKEMEYLRAHGTWHLVLFLFLLGTIPLIADGSTPSSKMLTGL